MKTIFLRGDKQSAIALIFIVLTLAFVFSFVSAAPGIPHQFFGTVKDSNGNPAPDNILIIARINGEDVAGVGTKDGTYGFKPNIFYVPDPNGDRSGKTIEFFINNLKIGEAVFSNGESTELDFVVSGINWGSSNNGGGSSGRGSGGGGGSSSGSSSGGGGFYQTTGQENQNANSNNSLNSSESKCIESWVCSEWLDCFNGMQKRVCVDKNSCGTEENKPITRQSCTEENGKAFSDLITGYFLNASEKLKNPFADAILLIVLAGILYGIYSRKKRKSKSSGTSESLSNKRKLGKTAPKDGNKNKKSKSKKTSK